MPIKPFKLTTGNMNIKIKPIERSEGEICNGEMVCNITPAFDSRSKRLNIFSLLQMSQCMTKGVF